MRVSTRWLSDYVTLPKTEELAERLTMTLTEVEDVISVSHLKRLRVGEVVDCSAHPNADSLRVCTVAVARSLYTIVCGASNVTSGIKVVVALPGTVLPDGMKIERRVIRGIESAGMICSPRELGIGEDHSGIWVLPSDAPVGARLSEVAGLLDSFELDVLANRPDCLGYIGIAREISAATGRKLREPKLLTPERQKSGSYRVSLDRDLCDRYGIALLEGVSNGTSPSWLQDRIRAAGMRPINLIVDVTNFVMFEYAQPLHGFDVESLPGRDIAVRKARAGEKLTLLNAETKTLTKETPVITAGGKAVAVAGIMGGRATEVSDATTSVVLESAHFNQAVTRRAARRLGIRTEASARFEKGVSTNVTSVALRRAVDLLREYGGARLVQYSVTGNVSKPRRIILKEGHVLKLLGKNLSQARCSKHLQAVGCTVAGRKDLNVTPPSWRVDLVRAEDLIEEVARLEGYDTFASTMPSGDIRRVTIPTEITTARHVADVLRGAGVTEIMTHSLVGETLLEKSGTQFGDTPEIANPLSADHTFLRRDMLARHLESVKENIREFQDLAWFESGSVFSASKPGKPPSERAIVSVTLASLRKKELLPRLRGILEAVLVSMGRRGEEVAFADLPDGRFKPGRRTAVSLDGVALGMLGDIASPNAWKAGSVVHLVLSLDALATQKKTPVIVAPPQFPPVRRDISVLMPQGTTYADLVGLIQATCGAALRSISEPDEYTTESRRSISVRLDFGRPESTMTDEEVNRLMKRLATTLGQRGYGLR
jgi:phenylalanyl-tRNA synthetase beta chain